MLDPKKKRYVYMMLSIFGAISLSLLFFFLLYRMQGVGEALDDLMDILAPFVYGGVVAYLLRPMCNAFEGFFETLFGKKRPGLVRFFAVGLSLATGILIVYILIIMIAPQLYHSIVNLWNSLPDRIDSLVNWATKTFGLSEEQINFFDTSSDKFYEEVEKWVTETLAPYISSIVGGVGSIVSGVGTSVLKVLQFVYDLLIGLIVAAYLLGSRKRFARQSVLMVRSVLSPKWADLVLEEVAFIDKMFGGFIDGKIVDSLIIGVLCYIGCSIFKFPNALLVSAIVGVTNVIPFFGPFIGAIPSTVLIMIDDPVKGLWFILFVFALQQLDGNVIGPKILGDRTGISSFWVLFSIILCGGLWGFVGMIIAVPLFAVLYDLVKKLVIRGLKKKEQIELWQQYRAQYPDDDPIPAPKVQEEPQQSAD